MTIDPVLLQSPRAVTIGEAEAVAEEIYGIVGTATPMSGERDANFRISTDEADYALKVHHPAERPSVVELHMITLAHITSDAQRLPVPHPIRTVAGDLVGCHHTSEGTASVSLVTFLTGTPMPVGPTTPGRIDAVADALSRLHHALDGLAHPEERRTSTWDLTQAGRLRLFADAVPRDHQELVAGWIDRFEAGVTPILARLPSQMVHSDFNQENLLVDPADDTCITGIIDFGDVCRAPRVVDAAIAAAYAILGDPEPIAGAAEMIGAYHKRYPLQPDAVAIAADLVIGRLIQSYTIGLWRSRFHPGNRDYILIHTEPVRTALDALASDLSTLRTRIEEVCR